MELIYIGASRRKGTSTKTGNEYDMAMLKYAVEMESKKSETNTFTATGYMEKEVNIDPNCLSQFFKCEFGDRIAVEIQPDPQNMTKTIVTKVIAINGEDCGTKG